MLGDGGNDEMCTFDYESSLYFCRWLLVRWVFKAVMTKAGAEIYVLLPGCMCIALDTRLEHGIYSHWDKICSGNGGVRKST